MARLVKRSATKPVPLTIGGETKWFCACGLSKNQPFCDSSHKKTADEPDDALCWYDESLQRHETDAAVPGIRDTPIQAPS